MRVENIIKGLRYCIIRVLYSYRIYTSTLYFEGGVK